MTMNNNSMQIDKVFFICPSNITVILKYILDLIPKMTSVYFHQL